MASVYDRSLLEQLAFSNFTCRQGNGSDRMVSMNDPHQTYRAEDVVDTVSNFEIWPFTNGTGCPVSDIREPHLHDFYVVQYVVDGQGVQMTDFKSYEIKPRTLYFASPGQLHLWQPEGELNGYVMAFGDEFLRSPDAPINSMFELDFFHSLAHAPCLTVSPNQAQVLEELLATIQGECANKKAGYASVLRATFHIFMVQLQRMFTSELTRTKATQEHQLVRQFKQLVSQRYATPTLIQDYADLLHVSVSKLNEVIKNVTTQTPSQIVRGEQILAAKRLLAHSDMKVSEVCFHLNFEDPSYFGRFFKRETGSSPAAFRTSVRDEYQHLAR